MCKKNKRALVFGLLFTLSGSSCKENSSTTIELIDASKKSEIEKENKGRSVGSTTNTTLPQAKEVLAQSANALGGVQNFSKIVSFYSEATLEAKKLGLRGLQKTWWKQGNFYTEINIEGIGQTRLAGYGGKVWGEDPINGLRLLPDKEAEQAMWGASVCLICEWQTYFQSAVTTKVWEKAGKPLIDVKLIAKSQSEIVFSIDRESKLPVLLNFQQTSPTGDVPVNIAFEQFRVVNGVQIPGSQHMTSPIAQFLITVNNFEINPEIDESRFTGLKKSVQARSLPDKIQK